MLIFQGVTFLRVPLFGISVPKIRIFGWNPKVPPQNGVSPPDGLIPPATTPSIDGVPAPSSLRTSWRMSSGKGGSSHVVPTKWQNMIKHETGTTLGKT